MWVMVFNTTFNKISVLSWRSILLVEETGVPAENYRAVARHWQTLSENVVALITQVMVNITTIRSRRSSFIKCVTPTDGCSFYANEKITFEAEGTESRPPSDQVEVVTNRIFVSQMTSFTNDDRYVPFVVITTQFFPYSWLYFY